MEGYSVTVYTGALIYDDVSVIHSEIGFPNNKNLFPKETRNEILEVLNPAEGERVEWGYTTLRLPDELVQQIKSLGVLEYLMQEQWGKKQ